MCGRSAYRKPHGGLAFLRGRTKGKIVLPENELVAELQHKLNVWFFVGVFWEYVHWIVGVTGIAASAIGSGIESRYDGRVYAIVATVCFGILGFANPQKRSSRFLQAYRLVDAALREYRCGLIDLRALLTEHRHAEELLNEGETRDPVPGNKPLP